MAMNYLQLVQRVCDECGVSRTNLTTVAGQTGEARRMVNWTQSAYTDILRAHRDWGFLRASTSFTTTAGQASYTPVEAGTTNFGMWVRDSFRNYPTATGTDAEIFMEFMDYENWRDIYQFGSNRTATSQPYHFTITPAKAIGLGPVPTADYTVTADYFTKPVELSNDTSAHVIPDQYEMVIVYRAMMSYGAFEAASEVYERGKAEYKALLTALRNDYLPEFCMGDTLV